MPLPPFTLLTGEADSAADLVAQIKAAHVQHAGDIVYQFGPCAIRRVASDTLAGYRLWVNDQHIGTYATLRDAQLVRHRVFASCTA